MGLVEPSAAVSERFLASPDDGERIVMVNLNRYLDQSAYPDGCEHAARSGREAYARYGAGVFPLITRHGGRVLYAATAGVGPVMAEAEAWDEVILVEYPSRKAFFEMVASAEYQAFVDHRSAAIADSRVIETKPQPGSPN